jgi:hypothetical protein
VLTAAVGRVTELTSEGCEPREVASQMLANYAAVAEAANRTMRTRLYAVATR